MDTLPIELLRRIFIAGCDSELIEDGVRFSQFLKSGQQPPGPVRTLKPFMVPVSTICKLWKAVAVEEQYFWVAQTSLRFRLGTFLDQPIPEEPAKSLADTKLRFEDSNGGQIDFHYHLTQCWRYEPLHTKVAKSLPAISEWFDSNLPTHRRQFQRLWIEVDADSDLLRHLGRGDWDNLQVLWIQIHPTVNLKKLVEPDLPLDISAPRLHTLKLDDRRDDWHSHFPFKELTVCHCGEHTVGIATRAPLIGLSTRSGHPCKASLRSMCWPATIYLFPKSPFGENALRTGCIYNSHS